MNHASHFNMRGLHLNRHGSLTLQQNLLGFAKIFWNWLYSIQSANPISRGLKLVALNCEKSSKSYWWPASIACLTTLHNSWIKIVRTHQPWSNLYVLFNTREGAFYHTVFKTRGVAERFRYDKTRFVECIKWLQVRRIVVGR